MAWQEIRDPSTNHLLARIEPARKLLELRRKKSCVLVDLDPYLAPKERPGESDGSTRGDLPAGDSPNQ